MLTYPNGITTKYEYNKANLVKSVTNTKSNVNLSKYSYTYYLNGYQAVKSETSAINSTTTYLYDGLGRLKNETESASIGNITKSYTYDIAGNRQIMAVSGKENYVTSYEYDNNNRLTTEKTTQNNIEGINKYQYDNNGNQVSKLNYTVSPQSSPEFVSALSGAEASENGFAYELNTYDVFNRQTRVKKDGITAEYAYQPDGMRLSKTVDGQKTTHIWDGGNIVMDLNSQNLVSDRYIRGLSLIKSDTSGFYLYNAHGDVVQLTDNNGGVTKSYHYDAFGNEADKVDTDKNPFRYCGEYFDKETDSIYLRARYYNPSTGRFMAEDPVCDGSNWYIYCANNPVFYIDPTGLVITDAEIKMFDDGEMAPMAYSYMMLLTYRQYLANTDDERLKYVAWENDFRKNEFKTTNGLFQHIDEGIAYMPKPITGEPTKEQHYFRNKLNLNFMWWEFEILQERLPDKLKWIDYNGKGQADLHQNNLFNGQPNRKYLSFDGHFELVYNANNVLQTAYNNPEDMGTYNYTSPTKSQWGHFIQDVKPYGAAWKKWNNTPELCQWPY